MESLPSNDTLRRHRVCTFKMTKGDGGRCVNSQRAFESRTTTFEGSGVREVAGFTAHSHFDLTAWQLLCRRSLVSLLKSYYTSIPIDRNSVVAKSRNIASSFPLSPSIRLRIGGGSVTDVGFLIVDTGHRKCSKVQRFATRFGIVNEGHNHKEEHDFVRWLDLV